MRDYCITLQFVEDGYPVGDGVWGTLRIDSSLNETEENFEVRAGMLLRDLLSLIEIEILSGTSLRI